jgi:DNA (cytosine-5)-methyltransferase 1
MLKASCIYFSLQMQRQIGNAVPVPVGSALGRELRISLYQQWLKSRENAIEID